MNSTRNAVLRTAAVVAAAAAAFGGEVAAEPTVRSAQADLIERFSVRLDARCQVAVLRIPRAFAEAPPRCGV